MSFSQAASSIDLNPSLEAGLTEISQPIEIPFVQYVKYVLPLDGYVFWLRTQATTFKGSVHYATITNQDEAATVSVSRVVLTTSEPIAALMEIDPQTMWIGHFGDRKFSFSTQGFYSPNARLYHYEGDAVYSYMENMLVDVGAQLNTSTLVVSNSLPAWLAIKSYSPIWLLPPNPAVLLYPSFLVPANVRPPYGAVHITPETTRGLQSAPLLDRNSSHYLQATETVRVTLYGLTNDQATDWLDTVLQFSLDTSVIGLMSTPFAIRDEKSVQSELNAIAMKKTIEFEISYNQQSVRNLARQLVNEASATVMLQCFVADPLVSVQTRSI